MSRRPPRARKTFFPAFFISFHDGSGSIALSPSASDRQRRMATRKSCTASASNPAAARSHSTSTASIHARNPSLGFAFAASVAAGVAIKSRFLGEAIVACLPLYFQSGHARARKIPFNFQRKKSSTMIRGLRIFLYVVGFLVFTLAIAVTFTIGWRPVLGARSRPLTNRHFDATPKRLARGEYLVRGVLGCLDCHSKHDWKAPGAPTVPGREGAGQIFPGEGFPGRIVATNLTPDPETGTGNWSDDQFARAIREGISHDGHALFPLMPYPNFSRMSDEDLASAVVYIRSLPAVTTFLPPT